MTRLVLLPCDVTAPGRYDLTLELDRDGRPDAAAWDAGGQAWPAWFSGADGVTQEGELLPDPGLGWMLRLPASPDAPVHAVIRVGEALRPGTVVTLAYPNVGESDWRVVGLE
jgi:hypothetical protein